MANQNLDNFHLSQVPYSILLATYNGSRFINDFLKSCSWQVNADLIVRDDGSSDDTIAMVKDFTQKNNIKLELISGPRLGPKDNFAELLKHLKKPYFFLADQDDIWEQDKIPTMLQAIQALEEQYGKDKPLLVFSDASLMDAQGNICNNSFFATSFLPQKWNNNFKNILVMPYVPGCTMLGNRALAKASLPMATDATMHDAWLLLIACSLGHVKEISKPLIRYRQHDSNALGANTFSLKKVINKICEGYNIRHEQVYKSQLQAKALLTHCGNSMPVDKQELCEAWANAKDKSWIKRRIIYLKYGFKKPGIIRNAIFWLCG